MNTGEHKRKRFGVPSKLFNQIKRKMCLINIWFIFVHSQTTIHVYVCHRNVKFVFQVSNRTQTFTAFNFGANPYNVDCSSHKSNNLKLIDREIGSFEQTHAHAYNSVQSSVYIICAVICRSQKYVSTEFCFQHVNLDKSLC